MRSECPLCGGQMVERSHCEPAPGVGIVEVRYDLCLHCGTMVTISREVIERYAQDGGTGSALPLAFPK